MKPTWLEDVAAEVGGMECSWKTVLLLVCASLGVQYTAIRSLRDSFTRPCQSTDRCRQALLKDHRWRSLCDDTSCLQGVVSLSQPGGTSWSLPPPAAGPPSRASSSISTQMSSMYLSRYTTSSRPSLMPLAGSRVAGEPEEAWCPKRCQALNLTLASKVCLARGHVAIKTVRVPEVDGLRALSEDPRMDLRIVHLVRDPRGILASRMAAFADQFRAWKVWNATGRQPRYVDLAQITRTCRDLAESASLGLRRQPAWLRGRYLLVRYEDLARQPEAKAKEIYRFVGLEMDERVLGWISRNTNHSAPSASEGDYKYSTTRDSRAMAESWRLRLAYDIVRAVQDLCNDTMSLLGYRPVHSAAELRNMSHSVVEPRTFLPFF
ncbi:hypothetical protein AGOR_G00016190 [Albula goreensis]|uniref:Sulfotransferase n=1 Tax=Albula goreensis TaxID=1534307 RepID=A0A8T3E7L5_9TELE|nr:hypothetical protein AGOR_G00016190 [Albula goreensis]